MKSEVWDAKFIRDLVKMVIELLRRQVKDETLFPYLIVLFDSSVLGVSLTFHPLL